MTTSQEGDATDAHPSSAGRGIPPVQGWWDFLSQLIARIDSVNWTWNKTLQVVVLLGVFGGCVLCIAWAAHEWIGCAVVLGAGGSSFVAGAFRRRRRQRR
jgi:hypothetical protein